MSTKVAGVDVLIYMKTGVDVTPNTLVGGQKTASLKRTMNTIETTSKDSGGWTEFVGSVKSWSMECDGFMVPNDTAYEALETAYLAGTPVSVEVRIPTSTTPKKHTGLALITDFPLEFPQDGAITFKLSLKGTGALAHTE